MVCKPFLACTPTNINMVCNLKARFPFIPHLRRTMTDMGTIICKKEIHQGRSIILLLGILNGMTRLFVRNLGILCGLIRQR